MGEVGEGSIHRKKTIEALQVLGTEAYIEVQSTYGGRRYRGARFPFCRIQIGKRKEMAWREIPFYIFSKSRFHLIDGYRKEGKKFILGISRNGYGRKVSFCRQGRYFGDSQYTWVSIHRPFHSQVTEGRERCRKGTGARPREQGRYTPRVPAPPLHPSHSGASPHPQRR